MTIRSWLQGSIVADGVVLSEAADNLKELAAASESGTAAVCESHWKRRRRCRNPSLR